MSPHTPTAVASPVLRPPGRGLKSGGNSLRRGARQQDGKAGPRRDLKSGGGKRVKWTQPGGITATHPALESVRGAGRAQQLLELQGAVGHEVVIAQGRLVEDGQFEVATVGDVGAELFIVRGFVGLLFGAGLAHAHLVHAHRQVGVQQLVALLEERVAQGPAGGLQPHSLANADPQVTIELHGAGRHAGAAAPAPERGGGGGAGSQRESLEPLLKPALAAAAGVEAAPGKSSAQAPLDWSFCLLRGTFPSPPSLASSLARWKGGEPGAEPSASWGSPTVPLQRAALPGGPQRTRPFSGAGKLLSWRAGATRPVSSSPKRLLPPPPPASAPAPASAGSRSPPLGELQTRKQLPPHPRQEPRAARLQVHRSPARGSAPFELRGRGAQPAGPWAGGRARAAGEPHAGPLAPLCARSLSRGVWLCSVGERLPQVQAIKGRARGPARANT